MNQPPPPVPVMKFAQHPTLGGLRPPDEKASHERPGGWLGIGAGAPTLDANTTGLTGRRLHKMWYETGPERVMVFGGTISRRAPNGNCS